ncbi:DUF333 domain-containing protein [Phyllobacterium salinisoli]|uniref:DUF333 domain-containing protein n=2 Tax=Phyllobacterium salinisoli TaxID=1899321 RepID=A0A368KBI8_9HYPH|nr:DUF333 domain-containing protein [Phyllobacterium salinisoli]
MILSTRATAILIAWLIALFSLAGCTPHQDRPVGIPNPASVYCIKIGGRLEIRQEPQGQSGYCHLPDGRVVDEWELFRSQNRNRQ